LTIGEEVQEISFSSKSQSYCVCFVSIVDSVETTFEIEDSEKTRTSYQYIPNTIACLTFFLNVLSLRFNMNFIALLCIGIEY
jgi:hypothetical protein